MENGLALWENAGERGERLMVRGQANLIEAGGESLNLDRIRTLFDDLERKRDIADFLEMTDTGEGVSLATVYNTLRAFCEAGLVNEVVVDGARDIMNEMDDRLGGCIGRGRLAGADCQGRGSQSEVLDHPGPGRSKVTRQNVRLHQAGEYIGPSFCGA